MQPEIKLYLNPELQNERRLIALTISHAHIVENTLDDDVELVPGACLTPANARILAQKLIALSYEADEVKPKEG
jgi:hypothetical protein